MPALVAALERLDVANAWVAARLAAEGHAALIRAVTGWPVTVRRIEQGDVAAMVAFVSGGPTAPPDRPGASVMPMLSRVFPMRAFRADPRATGAPAPGGADAAPSARSTAATPRVPPGFPTAFPRGRG